MGSRGLSRAVHALVPDSLLKAYHSSKAKKHFYFEVQVAEHCNLNCVGCTHFSSVAKEGFLDVAQYKKDINRMAELFGADYPFTVRLMGGEPLLFDGLPELFALTRSVLKGAEIWVVTNGILLPKQGDEFWQSCKDNCIKIYVSKYPVNIDYDAIDRKAAEFSLQLTDFRNDSSVLFRHNVLDLNGGCNAAVSFKKCMLANSCHNLKNGRLYTCSVAAHIHHFIDRFDVKSIELSPDNSVDIYRASSKEEIIDYMNKPIPLCRYCNIDASSTVDWCVSKKDIKEWT